MVKNWAKFPNELHGFQYALGHNAKFTMVTDSSSFEGIYHEAIFYKWYPVALWAAFIAIF